MDFNRFFKKLAEEWERTLMSVIMVSLLVYLSVVAYNMLTEDSGSSQNNVKPKAPHRFFDTTNTSYIEPVHLLPSINPFNFHIKITLPPAPKPNDQNTHNTKPQGNKNAPPSKQEPPQNQSKGKQPDVKNPSKQEPKQGPKQQATKPDAKQEPKQQATKPQPPKPVRKIAVQYRGFLKGTEEQIAFYSALDSQGKKTEAKSAKEGAKIHGILQIKSFDADKLVVILGDKDVIVKRGKKQEFIIQ